ncbi:MAG: hypothetical protein CMK59_07665 [Proteobacteria bacterium]|nr:hypothetical protein [Pseudomonadota bacterium]
MIFFLSTNIACLKPKAADPLEDTSGEVVDLGQAISISTLQQGIEDGSIEADTPIILNDVLVVSAKTADDGGFYIQDEGGGEWSGLFVYTETMSGSYMPIVGDKLKITGLAAEFYDSTQIKVSSSESIEVIGSGALTVTPVSNVTDWEPYESVLISLSDQSTVSDVNSYGEVLLSSGLSMDNLFFDFSTEYGATYSKITGVLPYSFEEYRIAPRTEEDLEGYVAGEGPDAVTIASIQSDSMSGPVAVENVIVTAVAEAGFWAQDDAAGEWNGIYVYTETADDVPAVAVGDTVNITGEATEYYDCTQIAVRNGSDVEVVGASSPTSTSLDQAPSSWENYEGVLVTLSDVVVGSEDDYGQFETNYDVLINNELFSHSLSQGSNVAELTGVIHYTYSEFKILPRSEDDLTGAAGGSGGNGGDTGGSDGTGGTGNGATPVAATITDIQTGVVAQGDAVEIADAVVIGFNADMRRIFVQDPNATENGGLMLYVSSSNAVSVALGDVISASGVVAEFTTPPDSSRTNLEVDPSDVAVTGSGGTITPIALTADPADWEAYEGMLVSLSSATVAADADPANGFGVSALDEYTISLDDDLYDYTADAAAGSSWSTIVGIVDDYYGYVFLPRSTADLQQ